MTFSLVPFLSLTLVTSAGNLAFGFQAKDLMPKALPQATDNGPINPQEEMNLTVHLNLTNQAAFDKAVANLYDSSSPSYQHWMTDADLKAYAPSSASVAAVRSELEKNGLTVLSVDPLGFSIRVHGTVASAQHAFQTEIRQYSLNNKSFQTHILPAQLTGGAGAFVHSVAGLDRSQVHPLLKRAVNPKTGKPPASVPVSKVLASSAGLSSIITDNCFSGQKSFTFQTPGASSPVGVYFGNDYDDTSLVCSFTSAQLQAHYGLPAAYKAGYAGGGQTIALVEAYGYPTIQADANAFSTLNGLPQLTSSNFQIIYPEGLPKNPNAGVLLGWDGEIALDVQWAHTIAPNAKILVVLAAGQDNEDLQDAISYVVKNHLANAVSNSWEADSEQFAGVAEVQSFNTVLKMAAAKGVSVHFSSGDGGDDGNGSPIGAPGVPADSPYATAVGGTAVLNNFNGSTIEVGWGNAVTEINFEGPLDPPGQFGFNGGAGGGESIFFAKPSWQASLPGTGRQVPDVSALSDPFTGVPIVLTQNGLQSVIPGVGGTSLGCPIFTAFWALANEAAGHSLGQAAPHIAKLNTSQINDIVPQTSTFNPSGIIVDSAGSTYYSPFSLLSDGIDPSTTSFISAIWPISSIGLDYVLSFGTDSSLTITKGWDNVTGFGAPNGLPFIKGVNN